MEPLLLGFMAALLAEWGDKTQLLVMVLAVRFGRAAPILVGIAAAALLNAGIAAFGGSMLHEMVTPRALSLLIAVALGFAGVSGFIPQQRPEIGVRWKVGALATSFAAFALAEIGDKTQFTTAAIAAHYDSVALAAAGAAAGVLLANVPAFLLGERLAAILPLRTIRWSIAGLFLIASFVVAVNALRLI